MTPTRGVFVTGTDTGVGKTVVACAIVRGLRRRGEVVRVMKPVETGVGERGPLDAIALDRAAGHTDPLGDVCPLRFALPAAPNVAARAAGGRVETPMIRTAWARLVSRGGLLVVEGAGGLLAPLTDRLAMADLASELALPIVLVARGALGTINHTRLALAEIERRGLPLAGVAISHGADALSAADRANLDCLRAELGARLLGEIPRLAAGAEPPEDAIDLPRLLARVSSDARQLREGPEHAQ